MDEQKKRYYQEMEIHGSTVGWVTPPTKEDSEFLTYFRAVCKRYNITPSRATKLEYDFVTRVAESEFYLQQANA